MLQAKTTVAEQLAATGPWHYGGRWGKQPGKRAKGDKARVNIVDEKLCGGLKVV
jgi:hypothetical protein